MTRIPSIKQTEDFVYTLEIKKGVLPNDLDAPHELTFEDFVGAVGPFHSMDVTTLRDGQHTTDIEFHSFEHIRQAKIAHVKFKFFDKTGPRN